MTIPPKIWKKSIFNRLAQHTIHGAHTPLSFSCGTALVLSCNLPAWQRLGNERMKCRHTNEERDNDLQVMLQRVSVRIPDRLVRGIHPVMVGGVINDKFAQRTPTWTDRQGWPGASSRV